MGLDLVPATAAGSDDGGPLRGAIRSSCFRPAGASCCVFRAPGLVRDGLAVVVSPLISLMKIRWTRSSPTARRRRCFNSSSAPDHKASVAGRAARGPLSTAVRRAGTLVGEAADTFSELTWPASHSGSSRSTRLTASISGATLRPEYWQLAELRHGAAGHQPDAFTATERRVRHDIASQLGLLIRSSSSALRSPEPGLPRPARSNLKRQILDVLVRHRGQAGIIYCPSRREVDELAAWLRDRAPARCPIMPAWQTKSAAAIRTRSSKKRRTSSWPRSRSAWASIAPTFASSSTPARRNRSSTISRNPAAPDARPRSRMLLDHRLPIS